MEVGYIELTNIFQTNINNILKYMCKINKITINRTFTLF